MADLYNLLQDDNLLRGQDVELEDENLNEEDWEQDERRDYVQLRPVPSVERESEERRNSNDVAGANGSALDDETPLELKDLQQEGGNEIGQLYFKLKGLWKQEVLSPELLPFDAATISSLVDAIADQEDAAAEALSSVASTGNSNLDSLLGSIVKVDVSRCKFLLCSLIRERLRKIEEFPWFMNLHGAERMSTNEKEYLKTYLKLLEGHLHKTVLDHFPPQQVWKTLDAPEMIDEPDLSTYVFCRANEAVTITNGDKDRAGSDAYDDAGDFDRDAAASYRASAGACLVVRYSCVRDLLLKGKIELLM